MRGRGLLWGLTVQYSATMLWLKLGPLINAPAARNADLQLQAALTRLKLQRCSAVQQQHGHPTQKQKEEGASSAGLRLACAGAGSFEHSHVGQAGQGHSCQHFRLGPSCPSCQGCSRGCRRCCPHGATTTTRQWHGQQLDHLH